MSVEKNIATIALSVQLILLVLVVQAVARFFGD